jgi:hypothetical protein
VDPLLPFIGKGTNIFIEKDLPNIHKIMKDVTLNGNRINIKNWNEKLEEELTKLKSTQEQIGERSFSLKEGRGVMFFF